MKKIFVIKSINCSYNFSECQNIGKAPYNSNIMAMRDIFADMFTSVNCICHDHFRVDVEPYDDAGNTVVLFVDTDTGEYFGEYLLLEVEF